MQPSELGSTKEGSGTYRLYGLYIRSEWPLFGLESTKAEEVEFELFTGSASLFSRAYLEASKVPLREQWCRYARLADGAELLQWPDLFEFLISADGRRIACRALGEASWEAFHTYLLGQVLSHALLKRSIEHLHCTAVVMDDWAVGFIGDCGYGKSSLAAAFLKAGYRLLTDDLLVLKGVGRGFLAHPGPPRIKLFPEIAQALIGNLVTSTPMNPFTPKLIIPLGPDRVCMDPTELRAIFVLRPAKPGSPANKISIRTLRPRGAFLALLENTFNARVREPERLTRLFGLSAKLAAAIPIKSLSYPRDLDRLPEVVGKIRSTLSS
jgi:hypothetical protein